MEFTLDWGVEEVLAGKAYETDSAKPRAAMAATTEDNTNFPFD
jgi:hypothetical protein